MTTDPFGGYTGISGIFPTITGSNPYSGIGFTPSSKTTHIPIAAIIGGAVGAIIFIIFILVVGWRYRRRRLPKQTPPPAPQYAANLNNNNNEFDKAELAGTTAYSVSNLSKNPSVSKPSPGMSVVSPVSPMDEKDRPSLAGKLEMEAQNVVLPGRTEMDGHGGHGQPYVHELHPEHARYEVPGQPRAHELANAAPRYEVQGSNQHPVEVPGLSANMNSGPYYELEGPYR